VSFDACLGAFDPIATVEIVDAVEHAVGGVVNVAADHAIGVLSALDFG
jgi:hypothetical protein